MTNNMSTVLGPYNKDLEERKLSTEDAVGRLAGKGSRKLPEQRTTRCLSPLTEARAGGNPAYTPQGTAGVRGM